MIRNVPAPARPPSAEEGYPRRHPTLRWLTALAMAGAVAWPAAPVLAAPTVGKGEIQAKKNQIRQLQFEERQAQRQLEDIRGSEAEITGKIEEITRTIRGNRKKKKELQAERAQQIRLKRAQLAELKRLEGEIAAFEGQIGDHLRRWYRLAKDSETASLFALANYKDLLRDSRYLALVIRTDRTAVERYQVLKGSLAEKQRQTRATLTRLSHVEEDLRQERTDLRHNRKSLRHLLGSVRGNQELYRKYLAELAAVMKGMETAVEELERRNRPQAHHDFGTDLATLRGRLPSPVRGKVVAAFGQLDPRYDLKKFQRGIVIRVAEATPVKAVASGRVVHAGPFRGYQELVVLDHGRGVFTVYGHLEALRVRKGGIVAAEMPLGVATYQAVDDAYDVYFELRAQGRPEDPMLWLKPGGLEPTGASPKGTAGVSAHSIGSKNRSM